MSEMDRDISVHPYLRNIYPYLDAYIPEGGASDTATGVCMLKQAVDLAIEGTSLTGNCLNGNLLVKNDVAIQFRQAAYASCTKCPINEKYAHRVEVSPTLRSLMDE